MKNYQKLALAVFAIALLFIGATPADAQSLYGSVVGEISDPSGSVIAQATITLTNMATGQVYEAKADEAGRFAVSNVLPGDYDLKAGSAGFKSQTRKDIRVAAGAVTRSDFKIQRQS